MRAGRRKGIGMNITLTRRNMLAGCLAGIALCGIGAALPFEAMAAQESAKANAVKVSGGKGIPDSNVAAIESYALIPEGVLDKEMRTYLQLFDIAFAQTGFNKDDEPSKHFGFENCFVAGKITSKIEAWYDDVDGKKSAARLNAVVPIAEGGDGQQETQEIVDAISQGLGLAEIQYTVESGDNINCSVKIDGVGIVLDVANGGDAVYVEIAPSPEHVALVSGVDKTELSNLANWIWSIDPNSYTSSTYANVKALIVSGGVVDSVLNNPDATAAEVFDAMHQLRVAADQLVWFDLSAYVELPYTDVARTPDAYNGTLVVCSGRVLQTMEDDGSVTMRLATSGDYDDVVLVGYQADILDFRVLEDDWVTVYGTCKGVYSYTAVLGNTITIPSMWAEKVILN